MEKASNRENIARVRGEFKLNSADTYVNLPDRLILSELQSTAMKFIRQQTDKRKLWNSPNIFQTLYCLKLKQVPLAECCGYRSDCTISRTLVKLPKILEGTNFGMLIQGVYSIDGISRIFIESDPRRYANSLSLGLKNPQIHYWIWDGYLYIGSDSISQVKISAYFEEDIPEDLIPYPNYCGTALSEGCCPASDQQGAYDMTLCCPPNPYDSPSQVPGYLLDDVVKEVAFKLLQTYKRSQMDDTNNMKDETR